jgi:hypothetical protein
VDAQLLVHYLLLYMTGLGEAAPGFFNTKTRSHSCCLSWAGEEASPGGWKLRAPAGTAQAATWWI